METKVIPKELISKLEDFVLRFIKDRFIDGVSYGLFFSSEDELNKFCDSIYLESNKYFDAMEIMRKVETANGFIYDIDMKVVEHILREWMKLNKKTKTGITLLEYEDIIGDSPKQNRNGDIIRLSELCYSSLEKGKNKLEVVLYSLSPLPNVLLTGKLKETKELIVLHYPAFVLKQWDLDTVNEEYLIPKGIRISKVEVCDILPNREGVRFIIHLKEIEQDAD